MAKLEIGINKATGTIALMSIILMVFAVLMTWIDIDLSSSSSWVSFADDSMTGVDLYSTDSDTYDGWQKNIPLIITILGVIMLILEFVSILVPNMSQKIEASMPLIVFLFSLIAIILTICFATWDVFDDIESAQMGGGAWAALLGEILCLCFTAGQAFAILKKKD
ncbi:MAG: hypothetical protein ACOX8X_02780 [Methanomethylophilus sp.]|jgi:hypothetical protein